MNHKRKLTVPNQLLLKIRGEPEEFILVFSLPFGKLELPTKEVRRQAQIINVKEKSVN